MKTRCYIYHLEKLEGNVSGGMVNLDNEEELSWAEQFHDCGMHLSCNSLSDCKCH